MRLRGEGSLTGSKRLILPDTCPDRDSGWSFRRSGRYSRRSVKPSADPTLVRTRHLLLLLARGSRRDQDHPVRSNAEAQSPAGAAQPAHRCPSRDAWLEPAEGMQHSEARPVQTRQNSRFWMSATSRTVIVRSVPNGGYFAQVRTDSVALRDGLPVGPRAQLAGSAGCRGIRLITRPGRCRVA
jgi:hypothetical protein